VKRGEFFPTLLGPSGVREDHHPLRMIAGLSRSRTPAAFELAPAKEGRHRTAPPTTARSTTRSSRIRPLPHMTVGDNVAYGLRAVTGASVQGRGATGAPSQALSPPFVWAGYEGPAKPSQLFRAASSKRVGPRHAAIVNEPKGLLLLDEARLARLDPEAARGRWQVEGLKAIQGRGSESRSST